MDYVRYMTYIGDFVIPGFVVSGFCSIHFTITLAGLMNTVHNSGDFVIPGFVVSGFQCIRICWSNLVVNKHLTQKGVIYIGRLA